MGRALGRPSPSISRFSAQSRVNVCGTFVARLPRYPHMTAVNHRRSGPDRRRVPSGGRRTSDRVGKYPPVLIAESYAGVRNSCARYLDRFNFQVVEAVDGEQALRQITVDPPQVIL